MFFLLKMELRSLSLTGIQRSTSQIDNSWEKRWNMTFLLMLFCFLIQINLDNDYNYAK